MGATICGFAARRGLRWRSTARRRSELTVWRLIGILLVVWLVVTVVGAVIKGLFWLAVVGALFFVATAAHRREQAQAGAPGGRR